MTFSRRWNLKQSLRAQNPLEGGPVPTAKRVLVLEDDANLGRMITIFLESKGFEVVAVASGLEGLREIMAGDFAAVLCDIMMPGLPGDMFYRAVEKTRPDLAPAFVFMTGFLSDCRIADFIESIGGFVLQKPFPLSSLLEAMGLAEQRREAFIAAALLAPPSETTAALEFSQGAFAAPDYPFAPAPEFDLAALRAQLPQEAFVLASGPPEISARDIAARRWRMAGWACGILLTAGFIFGSYYAELKTRVAAVTTSRDALKRDWSHVSRELARSQENRTRILNEQTLAAQLAAERARPRLSAMLRAAVPSAGKGIELLEVTSRHDSGESGAAEIRVRGIATGTPPRALLEQFHQDVENALRALSYAPAPLAHLSPEVIEPGKPGDTPRIGFEMVITHRPSKTSIAAAQKTP